ncbi:MAG: membrane protein insertion efficiency factor YidD [Sutterella sp.]|nr:membrane protein insertion efficiency factor YidD [Sutterella sp.]
MLATCLKSFIRLYQWTLSPWVGRGCRFQPTCSQYALEAIERYGALRGGYLMVRRLLRCHPLGGCGYDPVPETFSWRHIRSATAFEWSDEKNRHHKCCGQIFKLKK